MEMTRPKISRNMIPTPYSELNTVLREFVNSAREILQNNFVGAYLQDSFAIDDFDIHSC